MKLTLSDAKPCKLASKKVVNVCATCGEEVIKMRKMDNAVCFKCKTHNNKRYAQASYAKKKLSWN